MAIDLQISQIHEGTCQSGIPDSEATRFAEPLDGNNRCFGCYSVESRRQRRIHEIVPKTENDAGHRNSVPASISLPCLRLARNRSSFSAPAAKTSSKLHRDPLLGEISTQCTSTDLRNDVQLFPVRTKILKDTVTRRLIEEDVSPDHLTLCIRRANQG